MMYRCCSSTQAGLKQGFALSKMHEALLFPEVCNHGFGGRGELEGASPRCRGYEAPRETVANITNKIQ